LECRRFKNERKVLRQEVGTGWMKIAWVLGNRNMSSHTMEFIDSTGRLQTDLRCSDTTTGDCADVKHIAEEISVTTVIEGGLRQSSAAEIFLVLFLIGRHETMRRHGYENVQGLALEMKLRQRRSDIRIFEIATQGIPMLLLSRLSGVLLQAVEIFSSSYCSIVGSSFDCLLCYVNGLLRGMRFWSISGLITC
jgi:hypothetical protein